MAKDKMAVLSPIHIPNNLDKCKGCGHRRDAHVDQVSNAVYRHYGVASGPPKDPNRKCIDLGPAGEFGSHLCPCKGFQEPARKAKKGKHVVA